LFGFGIVLSLLLPCPAHASQFEVIHSFTRGSPGGYWASGQLAMDQDGAIYGTTGGGGFICPTAQFSCGGTVYKLARPQTSGGQWPYRVIASFKGGYDGSYPVSGVTRTMDGVLFGSTTYGGRVDCPYEPHGWGCGTLFRLSPPVPGETKWRKAVLHRFITKNDGRLPDSPPQSHGSGTFIGVTSSGGLYDAGMGYRLTQNSVGPSSAPLRTPLYVYNEISRGWLRSTDGGRPQDWDDCGEDETYNDTEERCQCTYGVFNTNLSKCCTPDTAVSHCNSTGAPLASRRSGQRYSLAAGPFRGSGSLYGAARENGDDNCIGSGNLGCGVIYEFVREAGGEFSYHVRYSFLGGTDGYWPIGKLAIGPDGSLYGTTLWGGTSCPLEPVAGRGCGTVFRLRPPPQGSTVWTETILYRFTGGQDGALPAGGVLLGLDGALYGATTNGGGCSYSSRGCGTVFKLTRPADLTKPWNETILHRFQNGPDGMSPNGQLIYDSNRAIYGTAIDVVFRITP
jgi:hypothetical protein